MIVIRKERVKGMGLYRHGSKDYSIEIPHEEEKPIVGQVVWLAGDGKSVVTVGKVDYLLCDGREVGRRQYPELFTVLGSRYGGGDGVKTYNLPDLGDLWGVNGYIRSGSA